MQHFIVGYAGAVERVRNEFAQRIRQILTDKRLTQTQLAELALVTRPTVGGWLRGAMPYRRTIVRMARKLDVSTEWLWFGTGAASPQESDDKDVMADPTATLLEELIDEYRDLFSENSKRLERYRHQILNLTRLYHQRANTMREQLKKKSLPSSGKAVTGASMVLPESLDELLARVRRAVSVRGERKALIDYLGVSQQQFSDWISTRKTAPKPNGATAVRLLNWLTAKEAEQKIKNSEDTRMSSEQSTQLQESKHGKPKAEPEKSSRKKKSQSTTHRSR